MTTLRECFGLVCPKCGRDDHIRICAYAMVALTPNGSVETNDACHEWSPDHYCGCSSCGFEATVAEFSTERCGVPS